VPHARSQHSSARLRVSSNNAFIGNHLQARADVFCPFAPQFIPRKGDLARRTLARWLA